MISIYILIFFSAFYFLIKLNYFNKINLITWNIQAAPMQI